MKKAAIFGVIVTCIPFNPLHSQNPSQSDIRTEMQSKIDRLLSIDGYSLEAEIEDWADSDMSALMSGQNKDGQWIVGSDFLLTPYYSQRLPAEALANMELNTEFSNLSMIQQGLGITTTEAIDWFNTNSNEGLVVREKESGETFGVFPGNGTLGEFEDGQFRVNNVPFPNNVEVTIASGDEWSNAKMELLEQHKDQDLNGSAFRGIRTVATNAKKATMTWAANLCPGFVYPAEVTLYLDSSFNFIIANTGLGTEIKIIMSDACDGLDRFLDAELRRQSIADTQD